MDTYQSVRKKTKAIFDFQLEKKFTIWRSCTSYSKRRSLSPSNLFDQFAL